MRLIFKLTQAGKDQIDNIIKQFADALSPKEIKAILEDVMPSFLQRAKMSVPKRTGAMEKALIANVRKGKKSKQYIGLVGTSKDYTRQKSGHYKPSRITHIVERGRTSYRPYPGRRFLESALSGGSSEAENKIISLLNERLLKAANQAGVAVK